MCISSARKLSLLVIREDDRRFISWRGLPFGHLRAHRLWRFVFGSEHVQAGEGLCFRHCFLVVDGKVGASIGQVASCAFRVDVRSLASLSLTALSCQTTPCFTHVAASKCVLTLSDTTDELLTIIGVFTHFFGVETTIEERGFFQKLAVLIGTRAARLSACGIAAIVSKKGYLEEGCAVGADGSLYNVSLVPLYLERDVHVPA
jgi:hypothetical protein